MIRKGISTWAFPGGMPLEGQFKKAKKAGFEGIEVAMAERGEITSNSTKKEMGLIISKAKEIGIEITSLPPGFSGIIHLQVLMNLSEKRQRI